MLENKYILTGIMKARIVAVIIIIRYPKVFPESSLYNFLLSSYSINFISFFKLNLAALFNITGTAITNTLKAYITIPKRLINTEARYKRIKPAKNFKNNKLIFFITIM